MARRQVSRNAPCPCGSGKKYKQCCIHKNFEWIEDDEGGIFKSMPIFPDMPHFEHMEHQMIEAMKQAGINPAIIYATEKTGRIVSEENVDLLSDVELEEWQAAIEEYEAQHGLREAPEFPIGTVARYGPDEKKTTKMVAGVILDEDAEAIIERWVGTDVTENPKVQQGGEEFFAKHGVKSVVATDQNMGCPHEEGEDFPIGEDCPFRPYWKGKQGSNPSF